MPSTSTSTRQRLQFGLKIIVPLLILALAGGIAFSLVQNSPNPKRQSKPPQARLVDTREIHIGTHPISIEAWGVVQPAQRMTLRAQVNGEIIQVNPELVPGGRFTKGSTILRLNPKDYILDVRQRQTDLEKARAEWLIEAGNQAVAKQEFDLLGEDITEQEKALVLRSPQLNVSKANVQAAQAALSSAKLMLTRTVLTAPFDASVLQRHVDLGTYITTASDIVTLVGSKEYWVEVSVPISQLRWIKIPRTPNEKGSPVKLYHDTVWGETAFRTGSVIRLLSDLEAEGRMARILVSIQDPLNLYTNNPEGPTVLLGTYLRAEIQGKELEHVVKVDRHILHDQETVWLLNAENTLEIRQVDIAFRGPKDVLISNGLQHGEHLIVTDIPSPTEGMALIRMTPAEAQLQSDSVHGH
ncbi:efflux RND transporter periplasmic adaptor subunit [Nitrospira sp. M1]